MSSTLPSGSSRSDSLIEYPSRFPIKVMGLKVEGLVHAVTTVAAAGAVHWIRLLQVTGGYVVAWTTSATSQIQVAGLAVSGTTVTASAATASEGTIRP